jgi:DNA repair protein RecO (recombination protein O)
MRLETHAIICSVRPHGEHGAVVRAFTPYEGVLAGYVRGGRSRRLRPILLPGNLVAAEFRARTADQLPHLGVELVASRGALHSEPLPAAAIEWLTALTSTALPEAQTFPRLYEALDGVLAAVEAAPTARIWAAALAGYELLILSELGFGLDLSECAATGLREDLAWVSPKSGRAIGAAAGEAYRHRLFALPRFLVEGGGGRWEDIHAALAITGHFLARDILIDRQAEVLAARDRLLDRLRRASC